MADLPKEWEAIIAENTIGCAEHVCDRVRNAVSSTYNLHNQPPKELTEAEMVKAYFDKVHAGNGATFEEGLRAVIAAHIAKQRAPEVVTFRAARNKGNHKIIDMVDATQPLNQYWEWLEPAQTFKVVLS